ncbi:response regulator [Clostridioides difficile P15]|nr:response regulator [Clostridioides difficile P15]
MNSVLIIDDDKELCALMKKCVEQENLSAITAHCGAEGLHLVDKNRHTLSLVILDIMMPDIDGFQVLKKIRETSNIPVIMLTAKNDEDDKVSGLRLGADDYLTKPFSINELMARVNSLIRRYTMLNPAFITDTDCIIINGMILTRQTELFLSIIFLFNLQAKNLIYLLFWLLIRDGCLPKNRFIHKYGKKNMLLTIVTSCLSSVN